MKLNTRYVRSKFLFVPVFTPLSGRLKALPILDKVFSRVLIDAPHPLIMVENQKP